MNLKKRVENSKKTLIHVNMDPKKKKRFDEKKTHKLLIESCTCILTMNTGQAIAIFT